MSTNSDFDYHDALIQIEMLFQSHILSFGYKEYSLETYADKKYFQEWKGREGCRDTDEMRAGQNIDGILGSEDPSDGEVLTYLQYVLNIAELVRRSFHKEDGYSFDVRNYTELLTRVRALLRQLGYDAKYVPEKEYLYLVPHNPALDALETNEGDRIGTAVTEYRSTAVAGQVEKKKELLCTLAKEVESYDDNRLASNNQLYSRIRFLLDNVNIENDNTEGGHRVDRVAAMDASELETWYDKAFQLMLLRIMTERSQSQLADVDKLADECGEPIQLITEEEIAELLSGPSDPEAPGGAHAEAGTPAAEAPVSSDADSRERERSTGERNVPAKQRGENHSVRNAIIAVIAADILFIIFLLCYFFL